MTKNGGKFVTEPQWWIFTFGSGQPNGGHYVKFYGTYGEARDKMFAKYGNKWGFQYSEKEWEYYKNDPNRTWELETELEVAE